MSRLLWLALCVSLVPLVSSNDKLGVGSRFGQFLRRFEAKQEANKLEERAQLKLEVERMFNTTFDSLIGLSKVNIMDKDKMDHGIRKTITIAELNQNELGTAEYGLTDEALLGDEQYRAQRLGYRRDMRTSRLGDDPSQYEVKFDVVWAQLLREKNKTEKQLLAEAPKQFDWRDVRGAVSPIKNQGNCGSCWTFSTTGAIEGQYGIVRNQSVSLSEEELVDCDKVDEGCNGGLPQNAFQQTIELGGLESESDYPYNPSRAKGGCKLSKKATKYSIKGFTNLPNDEEKIKAWVAYRGPVSIGVNAFAMQFYRHGVSHPWKIFCNPIELDHAVLIVGYGQEKNKRGKIIPYWIIKNSWGTSWGENGYYRIYRGSNVCGVASDVSAPLLSV